MDVDKKIENRDWSRLHIANGAIHFFLYQQDGERQSWSVADTLTNRQFVEWVQIHDAPIPDKQDRAP